jgi:6-phosphofructo-2-kinase
MASPCPLQAPLVVCVVGPTCHGKSLASHKICRHLNWKGEGAKVFSAPMNADQDTLKDVQDWFDAENNVAVGCFKIILSDLCFNKFVLWLYFRSSMVCT